MAILSFYISAESVRMNIVRTLHSMIFFRYIILKMINKWYIYFLFNILKVNVQLTAFVTNHTPFPPMLKSEWTTLRGERPSTIGRCENHRHRHDDLLWSSKVHGDTKFLLRFWHWIVIRSYNQDFILHLESGLDHRFSSTLVLTPYSFS